MATSTLSSPPAGSSELLKHIPVPTPLSQRQRPPWYSYHPRAADEEAFVSLPSLPASGTSEPTSVFLTPLYPTDAPAMNRILNTPEVSPRLLRLPFPYTLDHAVSYVDLQQSSAATSLPLQAIRLAHPSAEGRFVGSVGLTERTSNSFELGYYLDPGFWGKGIMRMAVLGALTWAIEEVGVQEVRVRVVVGNLRSLRLLEEIVGTMGFERLEDEDIVWKAEGTKVLRVWRWQAGRSSDLRGEL